MSYKFAICPDFDPQQSVGWLTFRNWLQDALEESVGLGLYNTYEDYRKAIEEQDFQLVYANPYDAAMLLRDRGFLPLVHPPSNRDEGVILVKSTHPAKAVEDLKAPLKVAAADGPEVEMICKIMLEPAEIGPSDIEMLREDSFISVVKKLMNNEIAVGFGQLSRFNGLSAVLRQQIRILVKSDTQAIQHMLLWSPTMASERGYLKDKLVELSSTVKGREMLAAIGVKSLQGTEQETAEFMIDIMSTLAV